MVWVCKVLQNGDDAVVELPDEWVARYGVKVGDELRVSYTSDDGIVYSIINEDQGQEACEEEGSAKAQLLSRMMLAEEEIANGDSIDFDEFSASARREYDLQMCGALRAF